MKKNYYSGSLLGINKEIDNTEKLTEIKTTNVNVLLNRVRLEKKKSLNKRILFSTTLVSSISLLAVFLIIQS